MAFPGDINALVSVNSSDSLATAGHAARHNEVKTALEGVRDALGGTAVTSGAVAPVLAAGAAGTPSLSFTGDANTGLWSPAADTIAASTAGSERMRIDSSGNVGIGIHPGATLHVSKADSAASMLFAGTTKAIRIGHSANESILEGVDQTGVASYQPLFVGGSTVSVTTSATERLKVDANGLITGTGTSLGAWTSYTPTLGGTGWAIGNGTSIARYCQIGKIVHVQVGITLGSTTTFGSVALRVTMPVNIAGNSRTTFSALYTDTSASKVYGGSGVPASSTEFEFYSFVSSTAGEMTGVISTSPFTWASTDVIRFAITYEAA